ncbi:protein NDRG2-like [Notothenia coriiceps]|uniref:Protein NDRG2-like n=1 Tax=Notothenia coriiceps TaxID=8208 RepID=A0A6I9MSM2_9TELE|nr:PREDICTED: protein NDRG2-like [Notothenia coriiceps]
MTTEMQDIAITEEKPLLTGQAESKDVELAARILLDQGQEHSIETPHGLLHVTLHGTRTTRRPAILTFHDAGLDSKSLPAKLTEAFKYFIQGMGYMASSCMTRLSRSRTTSLSSSYSMDGSRSRSRTLSQGSQGGQMPPSSSQTMEVSC